MYCTKCGNKLIEGAFFCNKCGARVTEHEERINESEQEKSYKDKTETGSTEKKANPFIPDGEISEKNNSELNPIISNVEGKTDDIHDNSEAITEKNNLSNKTVSLIKESTTTDTDESTDNESKLNSEHDDSIPVSEIKTEDVIGKEFIFERKFLFFFESKPKVKFNEEELVKGKLFKKKIKYSDISDITVTNHIDITNCIMFVFFLIVLICVLIYSGEIIGVISCAVVAISYLVDLKTTSVIIGRDKKKTYINMSSLDSDKEEFIDTLHKSLMLFGDENITPYYSSDKLTSRDKIKILFGVILGIASVFFIGNFNFEDDSVDTFSSTTISKTETTKKEIDTSVQPQTSVSYTKPVTNIPLDTKLPEQETKLISQHGIYRCIGMTIPELRNTLGTPDNDPSTQKFQASRIDGGYINSYVYGNKVFEYTEYDPVTVDDLTAVQCIYVSNGEYISDEVHAGMTFKQLSKYIDFSTDSPVDGTMNPVSEARSQITVNGYECILVAEFPLGSNDDTPSDAIYIWCKDISEEELANQKQRMYYNEKYLKEYLDEYEHAGETAYVSLTDINDVLNVRDSNNTSSVINARLKHGTPVTIQKKEGDWYQITSDYGSGYVYAEFISFEAPKQSAQFEPQYGEIIYETGVYGYTYDFISGQGPYATIRTDLGAWHIKAVNVYYGSETTWYECYDSEDGDYYGWIDSGFIYFY